MDPSAYGNMRSIEEKHWWFVARRRIFTELLTHLYPNSRPKIVDVGCGTGGNFEFLGNFGPVLGLEADHGAAQLALKRGGNSVAVAHLPEQVPLAKNSIELFTLLDVLEHIEDDLSTLHSLHDCLVRDGRVFISVPAFPVLFGAHDRRLHHKRRYTHRQLSQLIDQAGFEMEYCSYFNFWLFPFLGPIRLLMRLLPDKLQNGKEKMPTPIINRLLTNIFSSEYRFLGKRQHLPFGLSLLAIARKH